MDRLDTGKISEVVTRSGREKAVVPGKGRAE